MNPIRDPETILTAWLDEGPTELPDVTRRAIVAALPTTTQRRRSLWAPWRFDPMSAPLRAALAVLIVAIAIGGGIYLLGPHGGGPGVKPTPTPSPTSATSERPTPTPLDPASWTPFTSTINGFSARFPTDYEATPATKAGSQADIIAADTSVFDHFAPADSRTYPVFDVASSKLPAGTTEDAWLAAYRQPVVDQFGEQCFPPRDAWEPIIIDGETDGGLYTGCAYVETMVFVKGRAYIFTVFLGLGINPTQETRDLLRAFTSTVTLDPAAARNP